MHRVCIDGENSKEDVRKARRMEGAVMSIISEFLEEVKKFGMCKASRLSGVSYKTITGWFYEGRVPQLNTAAKVADAMGLEFLLFDKLEGEK